MMPMVCPSCGRKGRVPKDKFRTRLHCKKCNAVFYLEPGGRAVLGEPPDPRAEQRAKEAARPEEFDLIGWVAGKVMRAPRPVRIVGGTALAVVLLAAVVQWLGLLRPGGDQLERLSEAAARAFLAGDKERIKAIAVPDTVDAAVDWIDKARPALMKNGATASGDAFVTATVLSREKGRAQVQATVMQPPASPFALELFWVTDDNGQWRLDGAATFGASQAQARR
ncbi:MAG: hypothetical protein IRY99_14860 [Isosphaeraceae bacterium]|nr:hypothetical protein [Isosphaeraceae bacterium]